MAAFASDAVIYGSRIWVARMTAQLEGWPPRTWRWRRERKLAGVCSNVQRLIKLAQVALQVNLDDVVSPPTYYN